MRKTDKKIDQKLRQTLTNVCEFALDNIEGYQWVTHTVNYNNFPDSLIVTCMFKHQQDAEQAQQHGELFKLINQKLLEMSVNLKKPLKQIYFKSEE